MATFKLKFKTADGKDKTITESHPKLDATKAQKSDAMTTIENLYGYTPVEILLNSDTTVWTADDI